jgi:hypothetical protein
MDYLCCPVHCVVDHVRWFRRLCHDLWSRQSNQNNECWILEESYQETPVRVQPNSSLFFQTAQNDKQIITANPLPLFKN